MSVEFSLDALTKRFVGRSGSLQFATDAPIKLATEALRRATGAALPDMDYDGDTLDVSAAAPAGGGPVLHVNNCDNAALLGQFLTALAHALEADGLSGALVVARPIQAPAHSVPATALLCQLPLDWEAVESSPKRPDGEPWAGWWVSRDVSSRALAPIIEWIFDLEGEGYLTVQASAQPVDRDSAVERLLHGIRHSDGPLASVLVIDTSSGALRRLTTGFNGELAVLSHDPRQDWQWQQTQLMSLVPRLLPDISYAYLTIAPSRMISWDQAEKRPKAPYGPAINNFTVAHLLTRYVFDVYGRQVLTDEHLRSLPDLDAERWSVEPLGDGYHLVSHRDLRLWFDVDPRPYSPGDTIYQRPPAPPRDVLDQARADFARALLTLEKIYGR